MRSTALQKEDTKPDEQKTVSRARLREVEAGNIDLGVRIVAAQLGGVFIALLLREGKARRLAAHELEQRRHGGVDVAVFDEGTHIAEEEGQQKGADVGAVYIEVRKSCTS